MGKKTRKTRWRTLPIADEQSDSEDSNAATAPHERLLKSYQQKSQFNRFPYSSQSTPRRRFQHDGAKSTRSSSTASENKISFNEDEYTKITTPRQDVLFKKGYLNKPKNYQTQTSTGTSTTSTGNSTGNGTPDYQSTDLEYESQFVFPNGFLDQNGIYYVNSYEGYPLMLFNPPTYYPEFSSYKSKTYSTGSLTESTSPNNEEATSQDLSGGETTNVSDYGSSHHHVYNVVYPPGYYTNGLSHGNEVMNGQGPPRIKKRRRRKTSKSHTAQNSTECSEDERDACTDEVSCKDDQIPLVPDSQCEENGSTAIEQNCTEREDEQPATSGEQKQEQTDDHAEQTVPPSNTADDAPKHTLKPDAEEFVPRAFRGPEIPVSPIQFIKIPPNFVPIPIVPFSNHPAAAFIPPGIPVNFPHPPPNFVGFVTATSPKQELASNEAETSSSVAKNQPIEAEVCDNQNTAKAETKVEHAADKAAPSSKTIDIATIVSKLEEAVKEQEQEDQTTSTSNEVASSPRRKVYGKSFRPNQRFKASSSYRRSYSQGSPQRQTYHLSEDANRSSPQRQQNNHICQNEYTAQQIKTDVQQNCDAPIQTTETVTRKNEINCTAIEIRNEVRSSPEKHKKSWKPYQNGTVTKWQPKGPKQVSRPFDSSGNNKHYSETLKNVANQKSHTYQNGEKSTVSQKTSSRVITSPAKSVSSSNTPTHQLQNQWISVSNRKKRKNKSVEDTDIITVEVEADDSQNELFESYDVNLLVDVVPPSKEETLEERVEEIINAIAEAQPSVIDNAVLPEIKSVTEIETEIIAQLEPEIPLIENVTIAEQTKDEDKEEVIAPEPKAKKSSKKGTQKPLTKRIIITDVDMSDKCEQVKAPVKKVVKKIEKTPKKVDIPEVKLESGPEKGVMDIVEEAKVTIDDEGKSKSKKKKKKSGKSANENVSTTNHDDSYDFLLNPVLVVESKEKTNDEISQELDRIIQKGMYSSLEEKVKSLNITDECDGFFKTVFSNITKLTNDRESEIDKNAVPDLGKLLQNTRPILSSQPPASVSQGMILDDTQTNNNPLSDLESAIQDGFFVTNDDEKREEENDESHLAPQEQKTLYPITEAVKEWMSHTRETTPDVEVLKSPNTIRREFCMGEGTDDDSDTTIAKSLSDELLEVEDEEVTIYTVGKSREGSQDLLEYWDDEIKESSGNGVDNSEVVVEDTVEVYESKYGQNEDYINIQREIREKTLQEGIRGHSLPHRAVCCCVM